MTTSGEMELIKKAIRLLHSPHPNSATELRMMVDEAIKQRYGPEKMLCNILSKQQLEEEKNFPGRAATPTPQQEATQEAEEIINLTNSPAKTISDSPDTIVDSDDGMSGAGIVGTTLLTGGDDDVNLKEFGDLNCCVCGEMMITATNRLIECSKCGALYHQECHKPPITDEEASEGQEHQWQCDTCLNKPSTSKAAGIVLIPDEPISLISKSKSSATSSRSSSSSNSSSPFAASLQQEQPSTSATAAAAAAPSTSSKHSHKTSKSHKEERPSSSSSKSGSSSATLNPQEKSTSHSSKRTHSSSSKSSTTKSSKHHDSSSKRKAK